MTEVTNMTSVLLDTTNNLSNSLGIPPILIMGVMLMAVYVSTRNVTYIIFAGVMFIVFGMIIGIQDVHYIMLLIVGIFLYSATIDSPRRRRSWDFSFDFLRSHSYNNNSPSFTTKILLVLGLAHTKKEDKNNVK